MKKMKNKNIKTKKSFFGEVNYSELWNFIKQSKIFIFVILGLFLISGVIGFFNPDLYTDTFEKLIKDLIDKTQGFNFPQMMAFIIYNNIKTSILGLLLGLFFGIFPLFVSVVNGYLIGFVFNMVYVDSGIKEMWKILPHGIFELPAFFLSLGLGLRLGYALFFKTKEIKHDLGMSLRTFVYVILPLLLVAGFIETCLIFLLK